MIVRAQLLLNVIFCFKIALTSSDELIFVHALWRHGDRTPVHLIPSDKTNNESTWPQGLGELTKEGITGQYQLGRLLRTRYVDNLKFLHLCNASSEIHVRSTDYNRTLMSAFSLLAGLINGSCYQRQILDQSDFVKGWYPFPVHTVLTEDDTLVGNDVFCPKADWLLREKVQKSPAYLKVEDKYQSFFQFLSNKAAQVVSLSNVSRVADHLKCVRLHNDKHPMPNWANESVVKVVNMLYEKASAFALSNEEIVKLKRGELLGEIVQRLINKVDSLKAEDEAQWLKKLRLFAYSAHDDTLSSFLAALGVYKFTTFFVPDYSSCIILELWKSFENDYFVKVLVRKNVTDSFKEMQVSGCPNLPEQCLLSTFASRSKKFIPTDLKLECSLNSWLLIHFNHIVYVLVVVIGFSLLGTVVIFGIIVRKLLKSRSKYDGYRRIRMDNISEKLIAGNLFDGLVSESDEDFDKL